MATVDKDSANWRLFGGGGLLVGGVLGIIGTLVALAAGPAGTWINIVGGLLVAVAVFFVAFGQTGSNGAVGASPLGKVSLVVFGIGLLLWDLLVLLGALAVAVPEAVAIVAAVLIVVGGVASAIAVYQGGVARGAAKWVLFLPVVWGILFIVAAFGWLPLTGWWLSVVLGLLFAATGLLYLLNRKDIG